MTPARPSPRPQAEETPLPGTPFEIVGHPGADGPCVFCCEHATCELPEWSASAEDAGPLADHWGWDVGAADLTRALAGLTGSAAVLSRFSRLVCDPNRDPAEASFVVEAIAGRPLSFNRGMDAAERQRRRERYFDPYHDAVDRVLKARRGRSRSVTLCSIHSFTPELAGRRRPMEIGVLFDAHEELAARMASLLGDEGFAVAQNEPYSGFEGLVYAVARHGRAHDVPYLELEVRQDLIDHPAGVTAVAPRVARALSELVV